MKLIDTNSPRACPRIFKEKKVVTLFSFEGTNLRERKEKNPVVMALRIHLFPYRTQKLSSIASMVLGG